MLVLSRRKNQSILIHDNIRVVVVEIRGDKVRLGFDAPREVPIVRDDAIQKTAIQKAALQRQEVLTTEDTE